VVVAVTGAGADKAAAAGGGRRHRGRRSSNCAVPCSRLPPPRRRRTTREPAGRVSHLRPGMVHAAPRSTSHRPGAEVVFAGEDEDSDGTRGWGGKMERLYLLKPSFVLDLMRTFPSHENVIQSTDPRVSETI
jgi:hypothetical protein